MAEPDPQTRNTATSRPGRDASRRMFSVPRLRGDRDRTPELRPRRVEAWLEELPRASVRDGAEQIYQALYAQNRIRLAPDNRLELMELYGGTVTAFVDQLRASLVSAPLPLSARGFDTLQFVRRLLGEMANGYKIVVNDLSGGGSEESAENDIVLSLQRATAHHAAVISISCQAYAACPSGAWRELHRLYRFAELRKLANHPVPADHPATADGLMTIGETYMTALLLAATNPYGMYPGDLRRVTALLPRWLPGAELSRNLDVSDPAGRFLVSLNSDLPPVPLIKVPRIRHQDNLRLLHALEVVREVHALMKQLEQEGGQASAPTSEDEAVRVELLRRVGRSWGGLHVRRQSSRTRVEATAPVCLGINAVHYFASGEKHFTAPGSGDDEAGATAPAPVHDDGSRPPAAEPAGSPMTAVSDEEDYVELASYREPEHERRIAGEEPLHWQGPPSYRAERCRITDESAGGLGLCLQSHGLLRLRVGDVLGVNYPTPDAWQVGVIRWLCQSTEELLNAGVQLLGPNMKPVGARVAAEGGGPGEWVQALLLPGSSALRTPESVVVPRGLAKVGQPLELLDPDGGTRKVVPGRLLDQSGSFEQLMLGQGRAD